MHILIEEYQYASEDIKHVLIGDDLMKDANGNVSLDNVGYFFNPHPEVQDCVFILPKVLLGKREWMDEDGKLCVDENSNYDWVFGHIKPKDLINMEDCKDLRHEEYQFIYNLAVWIYRAISVFKKHEYDARRGKKKTDPSIVLHRQAPILGHSKRRKANTFLDVLLALQQWNKDNESFVMFTIKNIHSGYNKINWTRTISKSQALLQSSSLGVGRQDVIYLNPINKKKQVNFDEELLIIYFSILQYIKDAYGFPVNININFDLINGKKFERYLKGYGKTRLKQIKYKYFSDKTLELWELCYAFFEHPYHINLNIDQKEYLLVKDFDAVFEAIIDELIAGDQNLPKKLYDQRDGKRVDHIYQYHELTNNDKKDNIYYIGDSKYYKRGNQLDETSVYKQYTYARNVIQWNIDLFNDGKQKDKIGHIKLRDDMTEGYNVIPNFFISATQNELIAKDDINLSDDKKQYRISRQFENRLFDRDTLLLAHYDVNFLFVVALYGRDKQAPKIAWREKVRKMFRDDVKKMLEKHFEFYAITAHENIEPETYIKEHFKSLLGKIFHPFDDREGSSQQYYSLALRNPDLVKDEHTKKQILDENDAVMHMLKQDFYVEKCRLGNNPHDILPKVEPISRTEIPKEFLTKHYLENYKETSILIGGYKGYEHLNWIFSREGKKRDDAYNVRIGSNVEGGVVKSREYIRHAKFVLLYEYGKEEEGIRYVFRVKNTGEMTKQQMIDTGYKDPNHDSYFCYFFDEEISLGQFDVKGIIKKDKLKFKEEKPELLYPEGRPIYMKGNELIEFRE